MVGFTRMLIRIFYVEDRNMFDEQYGAIESSSNGGCKYSELFWAVSTIFSNAKIPKHGAVKRLFLITNEENPNGASKKLQEAAKVRAQDLLESGIKLELFNLEREVGRPFDLDCFYKPLSAAATSIGIEGDEEVNDENNMDGGATSKLESLKSRILKKEVKKRPLMKLPFSLGDGLDMGIKIYMLYSDAPKGTHTLMDKNNKEVQSLREYVSKVSSIL